MRTFPIFGYKPMLKLRKPIILTFIGLACLIFVRKAYKNSYSPRIRIDTIRSDLFVLSTSQLPRRRDNNQIETKLMPYVGNGHLASTIFDNSIYLNGLYNGAKTDSHRARVPNVHNFSFVSHDREGFQNSKYTLNMHQGIYVHHSFIF